MLLENNTFSPNYYGSIKNSKWVREDMIKYKCGVLRMLMLSASKTEHFSLIRISNILKNSCHPGQNSGETRKFVRTLIQK